MVWALGRDRGIADDRGSDSRAKRPRLAPVVPPATAEQQFMNIGAHAARAINFDSFVRIVRRASPSTQQWRVERSSHRPNVTSE
jgi:hypothetical protein